MQTTIKKINLIVLSTLMLMFLSSCGFFDKDNTPAPSPLVNFTPEKTPKLVWSTKVGSNNDGDYLKIAPTLTADGIYAVSSKGTVTLLDKQTGKKIWQVSTGIPISVTPGVGAGLLVVASKDGDVVALNAINGSPRWQTKIAGEVLAQPAINNNVVVIKTTGGNVYGLSHDTGHEMWSYHQIEPSLILRGASAPVIRGNNAFVGFANGTLAKLNATDGDLFWSQEIAAPQGAFAIERMIDIDADPFIYRDNIYVATYQGKIASLNWSSGQNIWTHDISSYTGMTADDTGLYITDAKSYIWSFNPTNGLVNWQQNKLYARNITAPALLNQYLIVGDMQGYLHWLNKFDGHFAARVKLGHAMLATPIVDNHFVYAMTTDGKLFAYTLG